MYKQDSIQNYSHWGYIPAGNEASELAANIAREKGLPEFRQWIVSNLKDGPVLHVTIAFPGGNPSGKLNSNFQEELFKRVIRVQSRLSRLYYKNAYKRYNKRINMVGAWEGHKNYFPHLHLLFHIPHFADHLEFENDCKVFFNKALSGSDIHYNIIHDTAIAVNYVTKQRSKIDVLQDIDPRLLWLRK